MLNRFKRSIAYPTIGRIPVSTWSQYWIGDEVEVEKVSDEYPEINLGPKTALCKLMQQCGSDKAGVRHNYTKVYHSLFRNRHVTRFFELGIGTTDLRIRHNMGRDGTPGASLRAWRTYFSQSQVFAADIDASIMIEESRIQTFVVDQTDSKSIEQMWKHASLQDPMDIIIDDGLHEFEANCNFLAHSLHQIRPGGVYIVEDINTYSLGNWVEVISDDYRSRFPGCVFQLMQLPNLFNPQDNNLLVVHTQAEKTA